MPIDLKREQEPVAMPTEHAQQKVAIPSKHAEEPVVMPTKHEQEPVAMPTSMPPATTTTTSAHPEQILRIPRPASPQSEPVPPPRAPEQIVRILKPPPSPQPPPTSSSSTDQNKIVSDDPELLPKNLIKIREDEQTQQIVTIIVQQDADGSNSSQDGIPQGAVEAALRLANSGMPHHGRVTVVSPGDNTQGVELEMVGANDSQTYMLVDHDAEVDANVPQQQVAQNVAPRSESSAEVHVSALQDHSNMPQTSALDAVVHQAVREETAVIGITTPQQVGDHTQYGQPQTLAEGTTEAFIPRVVREEGTAVVGITQQQGEAHSHHPGQQQVVQIVTSQSSHEGGNVVGVDIGTAADVLTAILNG